MIRAHDMCNVHDPSAAILILSIIVCVFFWNASIYLWSPHMKG
jgi:hypothetical protein